jgi:hypothetical protein
MGEPLFPHSVESVEGMKHIIDTSEVLGTVEVPEGTCELCASADASFDEEKERLVVQLEAFLRPAWCRKSSGAGRAKCGRPRHSCIWSEEKDGETRN